MKNDTLQEAAFNLNSLAKHKINFTTFSAKIKVEYEDNKGKQPDFNAFVRLYSDSVLWVSISATFLSIEAFKILITKDSVIIVNKLDKQVEYHPFSYMEEITHIPLNFSNLQDLIIGNPIYVGDSVLSYKQTENHILIATVGKFFKNLLTISADNKLIERSKLDDLDVIINNNVELLHVHYAIPHASAAYMARQILAKEGIDIPVITTLHGTDITLVGRDKTYSPVVTFSMNESNAITAVSKNLRDETYKSFKIEKEIEVIYNFVAGK